MRNIRLLELDSLRGLAALSVVCYHYFYRYDGLYGHDQSIPVEWFEIGSLGVQLFFMVSGFVIYWTLNKVEKPLDFIVSRFSRLYPVYWLSVIVTFLAVLYFGLPGREVDFFTAIANLLMFHEYFYVRHVDGVYWTLTVELTFYFWIFVLYFTRYLKAIEGISIVLIGLAVLNALAVISIPEIIQNIFIMQYLPFFLAGISFYKIVDGDSRGYLMSIISLILSLVSTIYLYSFEQFVVFSLFYCVFYLAVSGRIKFLAVRPLVFLGTISYSLYLLHQNIGYIIIRNFYELNLSPLLGITSALFVTICLATLFVKYIEKPSLKYIRDQYKNSQSLQNLAGKVMCFGRKSSKQTAV